MIEKKLKAALESGELIELFVDSDDSRSFEVGWLRGLGEDSYTFESFDKWGEPVGILIG